MLQIIVNQCGNQINSLEMIGHVGYDVKGKDIVCAAISSMLYFIVNYIEASNMSDKLLHQIREGHTMIILKDSLPINLLFVRYIAELKELAHTYAGYIDISTINQNIML